MERVDEKGGSGMVGRRTTLVTSPRSGLARWIVGILLILHGLIHLLGPLAIWDLADIEALSGDPTIDLGSAAVQAFALAWLGALVALLVAGVAVIARQPWWRVPAVIGVVISQVAIVAWWDDAAAGTVANLLIIAAVVLARPLGLDFRAPDRIAMTPAELARRYDSLLEAADGSFTPAELEGLPGPVQRYFRTAIEPGTPLARTALITMSGRLRIGRWLPFRGAELLTPHRGFVWWARAAGIISGSDRYVDGIGELDWKLGGLVR